MPKVFADAPIVESRKNGRFPANRQAKTCVASRNGHEPDVALLHSMPVDGLRGRFPRWKRIVDLSCILVTLPCWLPLILLVMVVVRLSSRGPVFYRQQRIGYQGKRFMLFKFRTMHVSAETQTHEDYFAKLMLSQRPMTKLDAAGDSRLIPGARFLRASGLDELPQIFNVLRGEMTLVGPRPCLPNEFERYEHWQQLRVYVPPGLTGYWQVNGKNKTTFNEMIAMDFLYIDKMSLWFDLSVLLKTLPVLVTETSEAWQRFRARHGSATRCHHRMPQLSQSPNGLGIE
jgi:lipopolysaccharide/colanic/teichoic acid biosynthesis glycosyltransferase